MAETKRKIVEEHIIPISNGGTKPQKQKHNSKRRKAKKNYSPETENVIQLLCDSILINEPKPMVNNILPEKSRKKPINKNKRVSEAQKAASLVESKVNGYEKVTKGSGHPKGKASINQKNHHHKAILKLITNLENPEKEKELKNTTSNLKNCTSNKGLPNLKQSNSVVPTEQNPKNSWNPFDIWPDLKHAFLDNSVSHLNSKNQTSRVYSAMKALENVLGSDKVINTTIQSKYVVGKKSPNNSFTEKSKSKKVKKKYFYHHKGSQTTLKTTQSVMLNPEVHQNKNATKAQVQKPLNSMTEPVKKLEPSESKKRDQEFPQYLTSDGLALMESYGVLMTGTIRINCKNYKEAYITPPDKGMDILIEGLRDRNRALEGDQVYVLLKPKSHPRTNSDLGDVQRTGVVVGIKTMNHNRRAIGTLNPVKNENVKCAVFSPRDGRLPRIKIHRNNWPEGFATDSKSFKDKLFFAKIKQWKDLMFAEGELINEIGLVGDIEVETSAILLNYDLDVTPYSEYLKQCIPPSAFTITEADLVCREDFRQDCVFTIDPATAVDLDDAVSCKRLPNGNYQVGVHISDVTHYLKEGTALDLEISKRATTVYLVQRAYHMLPFELCRLCSLTPGEDKLSFSVLWEVSAGMEILNRRFSRSIINSCGQFSYDQVQTILDGSSKPEMPLIHGNHDVCQISSIILFLHKLAVRLRQKRFENGALRIDQKKIRFTLDDMQLPVAFTEEAHNESHRLIEELMLLANMTVAEILSENYPELALLRSHSPPQNYMLNKLQQNLEKYDIHMDIYSAKTINDSLVKYSGDGTKLEAQKLVLNYLLAKPMVRAVYYCSGLFTSPKERHHYALNVPLYTHFTSPIRRYADIVVHRLLGSLLSKPSHQSRSSEEIQSIAENCNKQKYSAKMAGEASMELYLAVYIGENGPMKFDAVVCDVKDRSFDCIVIATGTQVRVYFNDTAIVLRHTYDNGVVSLIVKWPADSTYQKEIVQVIKMFEIVKVELKRKNPLKIEANLLREGV